MLFCFAPTTKGEAAEDACETVNREERLFSVVN